MSTAFYRFLRQYHIAFLRLALATIYVWFGALKLFHVSPAEELATETIRFIPAPTFILILGVWETAIGLLFLFPRLTQLALLLFFLHILGTFLPFVVLPHLVFTLPFVPTLEGQYIIKNLALIGLALTIGLAHYNSITEKNRK